MFFLWIDSYFPLYIREIHKYKLAWLAVLSCSMHNLYYKYIILPLLLYYFIYVLKNAITSIAVILHTRFWLNCFSNRHSDHPSAHRTRPSLNSVRTLIKNGYTHPTDNKHSPRQLIPKINIVHCATKWIHSPASHSPVGTTFLPLISQREGCKQDYGINWQAAQHPSSRGKKVLTLGKFIGQFALVPVRGAAPNELGTRVKKIWRG